VKYFENSKHEDDHPELLKIAQFVFAVSSHNGNRKQTFSFMQVEWTKERSSLNI
jgi:hypothetical protein